jgi:pyruvate,water dikinase
MPEVKKNAVERLICSLIPTAHQAGRKMDICDQAPSDYPECVVFLVEAGIDAMSLNLDSVIHVRRRVAEVEAQRRTGAKG